jgi:hypothetical protein
MISPSRCNELHHEAIIRSRLSVLYWQANDALFDIHAVIGKDNDDYRFLSGYFYEIYVRMYKERHNKIFDHTFVMGRLAAKDDLRYIGA